MTGRIRKGAVAVLTMCTVVFGASSMGTRAMAEPMAQAHRIIAQGSGSGLGVSPSSHGWGGRDGHGWGVWDCAR